MTITTYGELLSLLDDMGFIAFGGRTGIPNLADVTRADAWHTGQDTDPWEWKRMLSERRDGIYTRVEGGQALFISHAWHPCLHRRVYACAALGRALGNGAGFAGCVGNASPVFATGYLGQT